MRLNDYQKRISEISKLHSLHDEHDLVIKVLGLASESGEFARLIKVYLLTGDLHMKTLALKLGDVLASFSRSPTLNLKGDISSR